MPQFEAQFVPSRSGLDEFTIGYLECAEFTLDDEDRERATGFAPEDLESAQKTCAEFQEANAARLERYCDATGRNMASAGHDFWLTRNHHGAGYWDRGDDAVLRELIEASHAEGETDLYCGDDGLLYFT